MIGLDNPREKTVRYRQDSIDEQLRLLLNCARSYETTFSRTELLDGGLTISAHSARAGARPTLVSHFTVSCVTVRSLLTNRWAWKGELPG
jgi:hypothetical protein